MENKSFCPLIKDKCLREDCVLWDKNVVDCAIKIFFESSYLYNIVKSGLIKGYQSPGEDNATKSNLVESISNDNSQGQNIFLESVFSKTPFELGLEIIKFAEDEHFISEHSYYLNPEIKKHFLSSKGLILSEVELPQEYQEIMEKAWLIASDQLDNRKSNQKGDENSSLIGDLSPDSLVAELLEFRDKNRYEDDNLDILGQTTLELFWESKGIENIYSCPPEIKMKVKQVEQLARNLLYGRVFAASNDNLSKELASFVIQTNANKGSYSVHITSSAHNFWRSKGLPYQIDSLEFQQQKNEIEHLAQEIVDKEIQEYQRRHFENEKESLPELIQSCVEWAKEQNLNRLTHQDIKFILLEKNIAIMKEIESVLYSNANQELLKARYKKT